MPVNKLLNLLLWNAQGISNSNKQVQFASLLNEKRVDIFVLCETFLNEHHELKFNNYTIYRSDRASHAGGVAIGVKKGIKHNPLRDYPTTTIENVSIELIVNGKNTTITAAYSPKYTNQFRNDIELICPNNKHFIILGDLNAKHPSWNCSSANKAGTVLFDTINSNNFYLQHTDEPTHLPHAGTTPSTIDVVLTNSIQSNATISAINDLSSDHLPILYSIEAATLPYKPQKFADYKNANWNQFNTLMSSASLPNLRQQTNTEIDLAIENLTKTIQNALSIAIPTKVAVNHNNGISFKVKNQMTIRNGIRRRWQRCTDARQKSSLKTELNHQNNLVARLIDAERNKRWGHTLSGLKTGSNKFWQITNQLRKNQDKSIQKICVNDELTYDPNEICDAVACAFEKAHHTTHHRVSPVEEKVNRVVDEFLNSQSHRFPLNAQFNIADIQSAIKKTKPHKSAGRDGIKNIALKNLPLNVLEYLLQIFNLCAKNGYWPKEFKAAMVIPIHKQGKDKLMASSYRPISLLPTIGKVFEKMIQSNLQSFISEHEIMIDIQYGFRANHSTTHQLKRVTNQIIRNKELRKSTGLILIDIEKCFDSIWHKGLLYKMIKLKFPRHLIRTINSYLSDRSFKVHIGDSCSTEKPIVAGLPQGGILSTDLFAIYTADFKAPPQCDAALFADDTGIYTAAKNSNTIIRTLNSAFVKLNEYYDRWKIQINHSKTQAILFAFNNSRKRQPSIPLLSGSTEIPFSQTVKYLGMTLDAKLNYKAHIQITKQKAANSLRATYPLLANKRLSTSNKMIIFKSIIRPILAYAAPVWHKAAISNIKGLQIIQNKSLKIIHNLHWRYPTSNLVIRTRIPRIINFITEQAQNLEQKCNTSPYPHLRRIHQPNYAV